MSWTLGLSGLSSPQHPQRAAKLREAKVYHTICCFCSCGCGLKVYASEGRIVSVEGDEENPINAGALCSKGAAGAHAAAGRLIGPLYRPPGASRWEHRSWDWVMQRIAEKLFAVRETNWSSQPAINDRQKAGGRCEAIGFLGGGLNTNEENYLFRKLATLLGTPYIDNQGRLSHAASIPALVASFGFGASTNHWKDLVNARCILIEGANPAENHPMGMKWVLEAQRNGAQVLVVDPRLTRTAVHADLFARLRPGTDIAVLSAMVRTILENRLYDADFLRRATNARYRLTREFGFEAGVFSGFLASARSYETETWRYQCDQQGHPLVADDMEQSDTVFSALREHFLRYTPEMAERISGMPASRIEQLAELLARNRPGTILYGMGATQHCSSVQHLRCYAILQMLLGNLGKPGAGLIAGTSACNIQGASDMGVACEYLPGYTPSPTVETPTLEEYTHRFGCQNRMQLINLLKAWYGDLATADNEFLFDTLPRLEPKRNYSMYQMREEMRRGQLKVLLCLGHNPAVSTANRDLFLGALARLEMLVVVDLFETETGAFWKSFGLNPQATQTEVIVLPAASFLEKPGCVTNSGRWIQGREPIFTPPGGARNDLQILDSLFHRLRELHRESRDEKDRPLQRVQWDYGSPPDYGLVLRELNGQACEPLELDLSRGWKFRKGDLLPSGRCLRDEGVTACGNWLYCGIAQQRGEVLVNRSLSRDASDPSGLGVHPGWGYSWPNNVRILYNRASCDRNGIALNPQRRLVWWDPQERQWTGHTEPHVPELKSGPETPAGELVFHGPPEGRGRLMAADYRRPGEGPGSPPAQVATLLEDGPFPEHYEPIEGDMENPLHPNVRANPLVVYPWSVEQMPLGTSDQYPVVLCAGSLQEMWGAGALTRRMAHLVEAQPGPLVEVGQRLAHERGIESGEVVRIVTARGEVRLMAHVTDRLRPLQIGDRIVDIVWAPVHYGPLGTATGESVNRVTLDALEPNVGIHSRGVCLCDVRKLPPEVLEGSE